MLPWPFPRWDAGEEQAPEEQGPSPFGDPGKVWNSGEKALGEPGTPPPDSPQFRSPRPSWTRTRREQLRAAPRSGPVAERYPGTPVPFSPQMAWGMAPSRMTLLTPWDPNSSQLVWGPSCASGASFSSRTLCHPSFWPLYEAASGRDRFPVMCREDVFLSDPLLPPGQRVPLYLSETPQQVMGSLKLLLPPPIMSPQVRPTRSTWLSGPELIALTGLLQMSQGEPRPSSSSGSSAAPTPPSGP
ncbi:hypothetical protein QTO34_013660 [Cnephaeus nilssonii]|uniref:Histone deacetylase complex subunit SAP25 n=1 Tax=Cnephaeus nilssonii TaxID=3371016 RepID=A0AA40LSW0_CNENI|nr:hypothetical protein QTO34_013660 [Eptesicus nilssonii]